jgi:hypothetical protein
MIVLNTRRRALGLLLAAAAGLRVFSLVPRAFAVKTDCFDSKAFGPWKGQATDSQAGARINQVKFENPDSCDLRADVQVAASFDSKLVVYGDRDKIKLPKKFLIDPANRLIVRAEDGKEAVNEPLCGNCTDIFGTRWGMLTRMWRWVAPLWVVAALAGATWGFVELEPDGGRALNPMSLPSASDQFSIVLSAPLPIPFRTNCRWRRDVGGHGMGLQETNRQCQSDA